MTLAKLDKAFGFRETADGEWKAVCPVCELESLKLDPGKAKDDESEQALLLHCFECRDTRKVLAAKGLSLSDLWDTPAEVSTYFGIHESARKHSFPLGSPALVDSVYRDFLAKLDKHENGYWVLPTDQQERAELAAGLCLRHGNAIFEVPGFVLKDNNAPGINGVAQDPAYLVPVRSREGKLVALKARYENAVDSKYTSLSSAAYGGPKAQSAIHFPEGLPRRFSVVWVTEGEKKADYATSKGYHCLSIPGVHSCEKLPAALKALKPKEVVLALDKDEAGIKGTIRLLDLLPGSLTVKVADWPADYKGLDDCLSAGVAPTLLGPSDWLDKTATIQVQADNTLVVTSGYFQSGGSLMQASFPPLKWVVPGIVPEGLTVLAGKPKSRKSWLVLDIAVATVTGAGCLGREGLEKGKVCYLALEDTPRRLQDRIRKVCVSRPFAHLDLDWLTYVDRNQAFPLLDKDNGKGALGLLDKWVASNPEAKLVIVDTLAKITPVEPNDRKAGYHEDYSRLANLSQFASERGIAIIVVTHTRKSTADDAIDTILGSTGITAGADGLLILQTQRSSYDGKLVLTGKDVEDSEYGIQWNPACNVWEVCEGYEAPQTKGVSILDWLRQELANGPVPVETLNQKGEELGYASKTIANVLSSNKSLFESKRIEGKWCRKLREDGKEGSREDGDD